MSKLDGVFDTQIIGCGPAGLGIPIAADRIGELDKLLRAGVAFLDARTKSRIGPGFFEETAIYSNSAAHDFLVSIQQNSRGAFYPVLHEPSAKRLEAHGGSLVDLRYVSDFLADVGRRLIRVLEDYPDSALISNAKVSQIFYDGPSPRTLTSVARNVGTFISENLVLATGAKEKQFHSKLYPDKTFLSSEIFKAENLQKLRGILRSSSTPKRVTVFGASHSAFAVIDKLFEELDDINFPAESICLYARSDVRLFYENVEQALADGYKFDPVNDVCPKTGRVFRYGGLRGEAKELYRKIVSGEEKRVKIIAPKNIRDERNYDGLAHFSDVVIDAIGYEANVIPIEYRSSGDDCGPLVDASGKIEVDEFARVKDFDGDIIPGIYGIGHGHGIKPNQLIGGEPSSSNHPVDSVNIYHGPIGELIVRQLLSQKRDDIVRVLAA